MIHRRHLLSAEGISAREQGRVSWLAQRLRQQPPGLQLRDSAGLPLSGSPASPLTACASGRKATPAHVSSVWP